MGVHHHVGLEDQRAAGVQAVLLPVVQEQKPFFQSKNCIFSYYRKYENVLVHVSNSFVFHSVLNLILIPYFSVTCPLKLSPIADVSSLVPNPWHFGMDPDPRIRISDLRIRIQILFSSVKDGL